MNGLETPGDAMVVREEAGFEATRRPEIWKLVSW